MANPPDVRIPLLPTWTGGILPGSAVTVVVVNGRTYQARMTDIEGLPVPVGGTAGQSLIKASNADGDFTWGDRQPLDALLTSFAALGTSADTMPYFNGVDSVQATALTAFSRSLFGNVDAATWRTALGAASSASSVPVGGTTGQALLKNSNTDFDTIWGNAALLAAANVFTVVPQTISSTTVGAALEVAERYLRNKGAGVANDFLEALAFAGMSSTSVQRDYAQINTQIVAATNAAETGTLDFYTIQAGTLARRIQVGAGLFTVGATGGDKGANTINATTLYEGGNTLASAYARLAVANTFTVAGQAISSVTAGAAQETALTLLRNKGAGVAADVLQALVFGGESSTTVQRSFGTITARIDTATNGAELGSLLFQTIQAGASANRLILGNGLYTTNATGADKGADTVNAKNYFIDGVPVGSGVQGWGGTTGGSANAQTATLTPAITAYTTGLEVVAKAGFTNTGPMTLNVNGQGTKNVFLANAALTGGEIITNNLYAFCYDGVQFQLISPPATQRGGLIGVQIFTTPGTSVYTPTVGANTYVAEVVGGGGGGGGCPTTGAAQVAGGSSGAGGGYARKRGLISAISGATITVGAKGTGGAAGANNGTSGSTSSIGAVVSATGGGNGITNGAAAVPYIFGGAFAQGAGSGGDVNLTGSNSMDIVCTVSTAIQSSPGGAAPIYGGQNKTVATTTGNAGQAGLNFGSGGGGGVNTASQGTGKAGGDGTPGIVIIWEYA